MIGGGGYDDENMGLLFSRRVTAPRPSSVTPPQDKPFRFTVNIDHHLETMNDDDDEEESDSDSGDEEEKALDNGRTPN